MEVQAAWSTHQHPASRPAALTWLWPRQTTSLKTPSTQGTAWWVNRRRGMPPQGLTGPQPGTETKPLQALA